MCPSLSTITLPDSVTRIGSWIFSDCIRLEEVVLSKNLTEIPYYAFGDCAALQTLSIPYGVETIGESAFRGCSRMENVMIPDSVTSIATNAFADCVGLNNIVIPDSVTKLGKNVFEYCTGLQEVVLSSNLATIPYGVFSNCTALQHISIPEGVKTIGEKAFLGCSFLKTLVLPSSMTNINSMAFESCSLLWHVLYRGTEEQWNKIQIKDGNAPFMDAIHHENCAGNEILDVGTKNCSACCAEGNHNFEVVETRPTCTADGAVVSTCIFCGESSTEVVPAKPHAVAVWEADEPSCTTPGLSEGSYCPDCQLVFAPQEEIRATGHSFGDWIVTKEASRQKVGEETRICSCGETETREIAPLTGADPVVIVVIVVVVLGAGAAATFIFLKKRN